MAMPRIPASPLVGRPRSRRASRTEAMAMTTSGAKDNETVTATPAS